MATTGEEGDEEVLRFEPWQSAVDPGFWAELARRKLDSMGLSEEAVRVSALYSPAQNVVVSSPAQLDNASFDDDDGAQLHADAAHADAPSFASASQTEAAAKARDALAAGRLRMPGALRNVNTFERFTGADRAGILSTAADDVWGSIVSGRAEKDPSLLNAFTVLTFADLKKWAFYYWFAFPVGVVGVRATSASFHFSLALALFIHS